MKRKFVFIFVITLLGTPAWADNGLALFREHCAACHGSKGDGGVGVPLSLPAFIDSVDDRYLRKSIQLGRPGRVMPPFAHLKPGQVNAIVQHMRNWTGKPGPTYSTETIKGNALRGKVLFKKECASCHGAKGEGGHGTGVTFSRPRSLPILAPAINNQGFLSSASDQLTKHTISNGRQGSPMPAFAKSLKERDINDIVAYIRDFQRSPESKRITRLEPILIERQSPYSLKQTIKNVENAVLSANMRLIRVQNLDQGLVEPEKENRKRVIVYACGFNFLYEALKVDSRVGIFLPCRITIVEHKGKVTLMAVNPKRLSIFFNNDELNELCGQMKESYTDLIEEALM